MMALGVTSQVAQSIQLTISRLGQICCAGWLGNSKDHCWISVFFSSPLWQVDQNIKNLETLLQEASKIDITQCEISLLHD